MTATSIREIEAELAALRREAVFDDVPELRTSVLTHIAWIPPEWEDAAHEVMAGLEERHPSRAILLFPDPGAGSDELEATPSLECFPVRGERQVCAEVIEIRLRGRKALAPASIVLPLLISGLPVFLRWRGQPPFGSPQLDQLVAVTDRLIVDSSEWEDRQAAYCRLEGYFDRIAVSDIAWSRLEPWRIAVAALWPSVAEPDVLQVHGPQAEALLLAGWLRSRLGREVRLEHEQAARIERVALDGQEVAVARADEPSPADLLSDQLDLFGRDAVYEAAVAAAATS